MLLLVRCNVNSAKSQRVCIVFHSISFITQVARLKQTHSRQNKNILQSESFNPMILNVEESYFRLLRFYFLLHHNICARCTCNDLEIILINIIREHTTTRSNTAKVKPCKLLRTRMKLDKWKSKLCETNPSMIDCAQRMILS